MRLQPRRIDAESSALRLRRTCRGELTAPSGMPEGMPFQNTNVAFLWKAKELETA